MFTLQIGNSDHIGDLPLVKHSQDKDAYISKPEPKIQSLITIEHLNSYEMGSNVDNAIIFTLDSSRRRTEFECVGAKSRNYRRPTRL